MGVQISMHKRIFSSFVLGHWISFLFSFERFWICWGWSSLLTSLIPIHLRTNHLLFTSFELSWCPSLGIFSRLCLQGNKVFPQEQCTDASVVVLFFRQLPISFRWLLWRTAWEGAWCPSRYHRSQSYTASLIPVQIFKAVTCHSVGCTCSATDTMFDALPSSNWVPSSGVNCGFRADY